MSETRLPFADRLSLAIVDRQTPLIVGIDPRPERLPDGLRLDTSIQEPTQTADAFETFACEIIDVVAPLVPAIKPQAAFFEMLGPPGMVALGKVIDYAVDHGLLVILDGKRNDIGSTATAYATGWLGRKPQSAWGCDALTVNPYLGDDSLQPMIDHAIHSATGLFALVKTSNPGSNTFQELVSDNDPLYRHVGRWIQQAAAATSGDSGYGVIGAVVGATHPAHLTELRELMPNTLFLVPGYGAQGGAAADIAPAFDDRGGGAVVNSSRAIIFAWEHEKYSGCSSWLAAVESATKDAAQELGEVAGLQSD
ncbi:MAG: orotidine-5'-phosphate decarboxylase [Pirellulaceae bacterium]